MAFTKIKVKDKDPYSDIWSTPGDVPDALITTPPYDANIAAATCESCGYLEHQHGYLPLRCNKTQRVHPGDYIVREKKNGLFAYKAMRPDDYNFEYSL
jgi:hypothetical protein